MCGLFCSGLTNAAVRLYRVPLFLLIFMPMFCILFGWPAQPVFTLGPDNSEFGSNKHPVTVVDSRSTVKNFDYNGHLVKTNSYNCIFAGC